MPKKQETKKPESLTFEESVVRLEEIVRRMESGNLPLEEALTLFQEGTGLVRQGTKLLDEAELRVSKLSAGPEGELVETEWDGHD